MVKYIVRRLIQAIPTFLGITVISYFLLWASPGSVADRLFFAPNIRPDTKARLEAQLGINDPLPIQYLRWLIGDDWMRWDSDGDGLADHSFLVDLEAPQIGRDGKPVRDENDQIIMEPMPPGENYGILRGDFSKSFLKRQPAIKLITDNLSATLELGISALVFSLIIGIPVGVLSAVNRGRLFDNSSRIMAVILNAIPNFWLGLILILVFGSALGWLPMGSRCDATLTGECPPITDRLQYLLLPTLVLAGNNIAVFSRFTRTSMLEVMNQDYVRTARAKGLSRRLIYFKHAMRNALIPIATLLGPIITGLWGGAIVTETIFSWPGVGRVALNAVIQLDYPVVMAVVIFASVGTIFGFLLSDIMYAVIDPRIRLE
jgi:peptide/nickel transport system permease protein